ncbi:hypothetical protein [Kytococcus sp. Marseille-QA3725]
MSTSTAPVPRGASSPRPADGARSGRPQWLDVSLWWVRRTLLDWALGFLLIMAAAVLIVVAMEVRGHFDTEPLYWFLFACLTVGAVAAVIGALATRSKPLVRAGATRGSVIAGHWAIVLVAVFLWGVLIGLAVLAEPRLPEEAIGALDPLRNWLGALPLFLTLAVAVAVVLRFGWGGGVPVLLVWLVLLPSVLPALGLPAAVEELAWPGVTLVSGADYEPSGELTGPAVWIVGALKVALLGIVHWLLMRRMPVD